MLNTKKFDLHPPISPTRKTRVGGQGSLNKVLGICQKTDDVPPLLCFEILPEFLCH